MVFKVSYVHFRLGKVVRFVFPLNENVFFMMFCYKRSAKKKKKKLLSRDRDSRASMTRHTSGWDSVAINK